MTQFPPTLARRAGLLPLVFTLVALVGCSKLKCPAGYKQVADRCLPTGDGSPGANEDAGLPSGPDGGAEQPGPTSPQAPGSIVSSSSGGTASSPKYTVRLSIGSPMPTGTAKSAKYTLRAGPAAARP